MEKSNLTPKKTKLFVVLSILNIVVACSFLIPNLILKIPSGLVLLSIPFGIVSLVFAIKAKKNILIFLSVLVTCSFYIFMAVGYISEAISGGDDSKESIVKIAAPEYTEPITIEGNIYSIIQDSDKSIKYIYFGRTECIYCKTFEEKLASVLSTDYSLVYYYNTYEMPQEEVEDVLNHYNIDRVPYLIKLDKGNAVDSVTVADTTQLEKFFTSEGG